MVQKWGTLTVTKSLTLQSVQSIGASHEEEEWEHGKKRVAWGRHVGHGQRLLADPRYFGRESDVSLSFIKSPLGLSKSLTWTTGYYEYHLTAVRLSFLKSKLTI